MEAKVTNAPPLLSISTMDTVSISSHPLLTGTRTVFYISIKVLLNNFKCYIEFISKIHYYLFSIELVASNIYFSIY